MIRTLITIAVGTLLLLVESIYVAIFDVDTWVPHIAAGLVTYLALRKDLFEGAVCIVVLAWVADLLGGAPPGVVSLSLTAVFFLVWVIAQSLRLRRWVSRVVVSVLAAALVQAVGVCATVLLGGPATLFATLALSAGPSALLAPVGLGVSWVCLWWVDKTFASRQRGILTSSRG
jgi:cell shape-determining protein MreD